MDCATAQQTVSASFDGEAVDADVLRSAKTHCANCLACAEFVAAMERIQTMYAIQVPEDVLERALTGVRAEYAATAPEAPIELLADDVVAETASEDADTPERVVFAGRTAARLPSTPSWAGWAAAAAVLLVVAGVATTRGVQYIMRPAVSSANQESAFTTDSREDRGATHSGTQPKDGTDEDTESTVALSTPAPSYVVFDTEVYVLAGDATAPLQAQPLSTLTSALDTEDEPSEHVVYASDDPDTIIVATTEATASRFTLVTRSVRGAVYSLRSGPIERFGEWPSLPSDIPMPDSADGLPIFMRAGTDDLNVTIFTRLGRSRSAGIAVAPDTEQDDPAAGNAGWTWWEPRQ